MNVLDDVIEYLSRTRTEDDTLRRLVLLEKVKYVQQEIEAGRKCSSCGHIGLVYVVECPACGWNEDRDCVLTGLVNENLV